MLALGIVSLKFAKNGKDNRAAVHDLGLAAGNLVVETTARGLRVHQMIGILPDKVREIFGFPEGHEAWTGIAIGYEGDPATRGWVGIAKVTSGPASARRSHP